MHQRLEQEMRERERVEQELQVARSIQQASLPNDVPTLEGWEISPFYQPAREVGDEVSQSKDPALCVEVSRISPTSDPATREHIVRVAYTSCRTCAPDAFVQFHKNKERPPPPAAANSSTR
jgi:hypothetical protein